MSDNQLFRQIPKMDKLLQEPGLMDLMAKYGKEPVKERAEAALNSLREALKENPVEETLISWKNNLVAYIEGNVEEGKKKNLRKVINATGIVLHTNLGRAPLPKEVVAHVAEELSGYSNLEYDLNKGERGERYSHFEKLLCRITGAEAAMAVNNNAAAVLLMVSALGDGKEVIVSRGEQIEIGGKFRIPDIIDQSGAKRVEVGTTNKTHLSDYAEKINENTGAVLKVHTSNYRVIGFTESVEREELVSLGHKTNTPVIEDLGSGVLIDLSKFGLQKEPTVQDSLAAGVDLVSFSGDKLFGGPQAGIIVGKKKWIDACKKHPLTRAMRIDKCTALMLEATLSMYEDEKYAIENIPVLKMLSAGKDELTDKAWNLYRELECLLNEIEGLSLGVVETENLAGGGSLPEEILPGMAVAVYFDGCSPNTLSDRMRELSTPVICRALNDSLLLDVRTLTYEEIRELGNLIRDEKEKLF